MADLPEDATLAEIAEADPEAIVELVGRATAGEDVEGEQLIVLANEAARQGVNIFRILREHPDATRQWVADVDVERLDPLVERYDRKV